MFTWSSLHVTSFWRCKIFLRGNRLISGDGHLMYQVHFELQEALYFCRIKWNRISQQYSPLIKIYIRENQSFTGWERFGTTFHKPHLGLAQHPHCDCRPAIIPYLQRFISRLFLNPYHFLVPDRLSNPWTAQQSECKTQPVEHRRVGICFIYTEAEFQDIIHELQNSFIASKLIKHPGTRNKWLPNELTWANFFLTHTRNSTLNARKAPLGGQNISAWTLDVTASTSARGKIHAGRSPKYFGFRYAEMASKLIVALGGI